MKNKNYLYASYEKVKGWRETFTFNSIQASYFLGETRDCKIEKANLLEIGFGSGNFLAWAKGRGARIAGTELNSIMLEAAEKFGVEILPTELDAVTDTYKNYFDTIVAFDVFEHLTIDEIDDYLESIEKILSPGGQLLLRFPNGQSPFGLFTQHGDPTHKTALSCDIFRFLISSYNFEVVRYEGGYRVPISAFGIRSGFLTLVRYMMQSFISKTLNFIYMQNIPWDPVVVLVLRKSA